MGEALNRTRRLLALAAGAGTVAVFVLGVANFSSATTHGAPGAPATLTATGGSSSVTLAWAIPTATGDSAISGYAIDYATDGGNSWGTLVASTGSTATSYSVFPLWNGFPYHFRVSAINQQGTGPASPVAFATPDLLPGPPTGVVTTFGDRQVGLSWTPPVANGGTALTGFVITWSSSATAGLVSGYATLGVQATSYLVVGLTNGVPYTFTVAGTNAGGTGTSSAAVVAVPLPPTTTTVAPTTTTVVPTTTTVVPTTTTVAPTTTTVAPTTTSTRPPARGMVPPRPVYIG